MGSRGCCRFGCGRLGFEGGVVFESIEWRGLAGGWVLRDIRRTGFRGWLRVAMSGIESSEVVRRLVVIGVELAGT